MQYEIFVECIKAKKLREASEKQKGTNGIVREVEKLNIYISSKSIFKKKNKNGLNFCL